MSQPTEDEVYDLLSACRFGETEEVQQFIEKHGKEAVAAARDESGNTVLHMCCANGHVDLLKLLLPVLPTSLLTQTNEAGTPPLHWAILNAQLECVKLLLELPDEQGGGLTLLQQKNASGRTALLEAVWRGEGCEEVAGYIEGRLDKLLPAPELGDEEEIRMSMGTTDEQVEEGDVEGQQAPAPAPTDDKEVDGVAEKTGQVAL